MLSWYQIFILAVIALRLVAIPRDRNALNVILVASLLSTLRVHFVTNGMTGDWKLAVAGAGETIAILAMLKWANNRTGYWQVACLSVALVNHTLCYVDVVFGTDIVYSGYEMIITGVALGQLAAFHETVTNFVGTCCDYFSAPLGRGPHGLSLANHRSNVLRDEGDEGIESPQ